MINNKTSRKGHKVSDVNSQITANYANILTDCVFKRIFGDKANEKAIIALIESVIPDKKIAHIRYLPTEQIPEFPDGRKSIFDIFCESETGEQFIVEVQNAERKDFFARCLYYLTFPITNQMTQRRAQVRPMSNSIKLVYLCVPNLPYEVWEDVKCQTTLEKLAFCFKHMSTLKTRPPEFSWERYLI